jgi:hypothetical protein
MTDKEGRSRAEMNEDPLAGCLAPMTAWIGSLTAILVLGYLFVDSFEESSEPAHKDAPHHVLWSIVCLLAGSVAFKAFLYMSRSSGSGRKFAVGCYTIFLLWMVWMLMSFVGYVFGWSPP